MDRTITALLPRGPQTAVLPVPRGTLEHPSFPNAIPAIIAPRRTPSYCTDCAWLAGRIRAGRDVEQYGWLALTHWYAIHDDAATTPSQTRHTGGAS